MLLFQFCRKCQSTDVLVDKQENGTMITIEVHFGNPACLEKSLFGKVSPKSMGHELQQATYY